MADKVYDLKKRTYLFALETIKFIETLPKDYIFQTLGKQLLRSATSVGANVVEAQSSSSKKDFKNFYSYALKSANESRYWLELIRDSQGNAADKIKVLLNETGELGNILAACIMTLKGGKRFS